MKLKKLAHLIALIGVVGPAVAQEAQPQQTMQRVEITGSSIKRIAKEGALPVEIISRKQLEEQGIVSAEQLIMTLNINGNGSDNLASNADVTSGAQRGNNGASSANLRGQGADSTLVLLNGRRVATHGMKGSAVDLNSIPFAAVERVEVLKDGASAIYGTDAIGGVINFILKKNYQGLEAQAFTDVTEAGGGNIKRVSVVGGFGDLEQQGFNLLVTGAHSENQALRGDQRDFVNTFQPDRGLSVDTRGTPFATVVPTTLADTILSRKSNTGPARPGSTQTYAAINALNLPGGAGCETIDGQQAYDHKLWDQASFAYSCAWDTGRAAVLQQPVSSDNGVIRGTMKVGAHQLFAEGVASQTTVKKSFSPNQVSPGTAFPASSYYPSTGAAYNGIFNAIVAQFPAIEANRGLPIAYRWRCMECGNREIETETKAGRLQLGADGPIGNFDYRIGLSRAYSESQSTLGSGFNYQVALANALGSGIINPFLKAGETQSQAALDLFKATSAAGVTLYGGKTTLTQFDASVSGEIFTLPAGAVMAAIGTDIRKEEYNFNGDSRVADARPLILNAPFDDGNALPYAKRDIRAFYAEVLVPVTKSLELTFAGRQDHYSGFGKTFNPKVSFRFQPLEQLMFRGSYNTGFRAPSFNQLFNGVLESPFAGRDLADPATCPDLKVDSTKPGCQSINPVTLTGGKRTLGPETAKQATIGAVWEPSRSFSANVDLWEVRKDNTIDSFSTSVMVANYDLFKENFLRDPVTGQLLAIDQRWVNAGQRITRGVEIGARTNGKQWDGIWTAGIDGSRLLEKKSRTTQNSPFGASEVGRFTFVGDLGLKWKHTAYVTFKKGDWSGMLQNVYRAGYLDRVLPGVANGKVTPSNYNPKVDAYSIFHASASYTGIKNLTLTAGIKNLFDQDPPFAITYDDNTGAGSSWEPRVADPRGRSLNLFANYKFL